MGLKETEKTTEVVLERMENTLGRMEEMSFESINITDRIVNLTEEAREKIAAMRDCSEGEREENLDDFSQLLDKLLNTAFLVNNISHELEKETVYQRDTTESIMQIIDFLYAMSE